MRKLFWAMGVMLVLFCCIVGAALTASADAMEQGEGVTCKFDPSSRVLTISGQGTLIAKGAEWETLRDETAFVVIEEGVSAIGDGVFRNFESLEQVTIASTVTSIGEDAFFGCTLLAMVEVSDLSSWCEIEFAGIYSNPACYAKRIFMDGEIVTTLEIEEGTTSIGAYAFYRFGGLRRVSIPASVTSIGENAFYGCTKLASVKFSDNGSLQEIGEYAFYGCGAIKSITLPQGTEEIGASAFASCVSLEEVILPRTLKVVRERLFYECRSLRFVQMFDSISVIEANAFSYTGIEEIAFCGSAEQWEAVRREENWIYGMVGSYKVCRHGDWISEGAETHKTACAYCEETESQPHNWDEGIVVREPSHTETGTKRVSCVDCGETKIEILGEVHELGNWIDQIEPTCMDAGVLGHYACAECGKCFDANKKPLTSVSVNALGHRDDPSDNDHLCDVCGGIVGTHVFGAWGVHDGAQHKGECDCGEILYAEHRFSDTDASLCIDCGYERGDKIPEGSSAPQTTDTSVPSESPSLPQTTDEGLEQNQTVKKSRRGCRSGIACDGLMLLLSIGMVGVCLKKKES